MVINKNGRGIMFLLLLLVVLAVFAFSYFDINGNSFHENEREYPLLKEEGKGEIVKLPEPSHDGDVSLEKAVAERRSVRSYREEPLTLEQVSQLLWSAQGITEENRGLRTVPSAGALYPLTVYAVAGEVTDLEVGFYEYLPHQNELRLLSLGDLRKDLYEAALNQSAVRDAPLVMVISANYQKTTGNYGDRGIRYVHMEAGHAGQNVYLQGVSLGIKGVVIGAFEDEQVREVLNLSPEEDPLYLIPLGK